MKALTICQPWAWAIAARYKCVENRSWQDNYRGPLAIHAGKSQSWMTEGYLWIQETLGIAVPDELPFGVILGVCDLVDIVKYSRCRELHTDPWASGPWCWRLEHFRPLPEPVPFRGAQGLFNVPDELVAAALEPQK